MSQNKIDSSVTPLSLAYRAGMNFVSETFDRRGQGSSSTFTQLTGQLRAAAVPVLENDVISQLWSFSTAAGTAATNFTLAVYDRNFNLVAQTANLFASLGTNVWVGGSVTTPWTSSYTGIAYLGAYGIASTTQPTFVATTAAGPTGDSPISGIGRVTWAANNATLPTTGAGSVSSSLVPYIIAA